MKILNRSQLAWAALALAIAAGSLVAQDGDPQVRKTQLLGEAIKAREEGNLQAAKEKYEQILQIDSKDQGASEGLASVKDILAAAEAKKKAADEAAAAASKKMTEEEAAAAAKKKADEEAAAAAAAKKPLTPLEEVAASHEKLLAEVSQAIDLAKKQAADGQHKAALDLIDGAAGALRNIPATPAAKKAADNLTIARQEIVLQRDSGDKGASAAAREEVARLAGQNADKLRKCDEAISAAESLVRKGSADSLEKAIDKLDEADRDVGPLSISNKSLKDRIVEVKAAAIARRALIAIEDREMVKADSFVRDYAKIKGAEDPSTIRLQNELASKRANPAYRNIDEVSPGLRAKDDKVNELLVKGRARYLYGDYQGALDAYREVLQYQPNNSESKAYQVRIRQMLSENSGQWNRGVTKGKLLELLDESWKLPEVFNRDLKSDSVNNSADPVIEKMKSIMLPDGFVVRDQPLERALVLIMTQAKAYDKDQKGVNIILIDPANKNPSTAITFNSAVSVYQALDYTCKKVGYSFSVGSDGVVQVREDTGDSLLETEIYPLSTAAVLKMTGLSNTAGAAPAGGAAGGGANPFGGAAAGGASAGDGQRPEESAIKNFLTRSGVAFEAPATLSYDGTNLIVYQSRKNLDRVKNIIRRYSDIKQVHIEAKFMEVEQKLLNELGANWTLSGGTGLNGTTGLRSVANVFANNNSAQKNLTVTGQNPIADSPPNFPGGINLGTATTDVLSGNVGILGSAALNATIRAIEQNSGSDLMSSPSLTVLDGKTAVIKVAQLLRYPQAYGDTQSNVGSGGAAAGGTTGTGSAGVTITAGTPQDFTVQEVGVTLEVTPTVAADDSIALNLKPKVTEFEGFVEYGGTSIAISSGVTVTVPSGFFQPIFSTREVTTDVTVFDGATVVIGGLTREEVKTVEDKVPVLGSIPIIGSAFRSSGKTIQKRSLMVFVTANLVSPGGATLRSTHPGMRAGSTFSNPTLVSPGGAVYREPIEAAAPSTAPVAPKPVENK
jgi:general secretion pathway protein D